MPNHVFNTVAVTANTPEELASFMVAASQPYQVQVTRWDAPTPEYQFEMAERQLGFSFHSFIPIPTEDYWDYVGKDGKLVQNWYDWNRKNWGTKWDAYEISIVADSDLQNTFNFQTAWAPPVPVFEAMVAQYPNLKFSIRWEEEQGFGGEFEGVNGKLVETNQWDIPECHSDWATIGNPDGCVCAYESDSTFWYADCPNAEIDNDSEVSYTTV